VWGCGQRLQRRTFHHIDHPTPHSHTRTDSAGSTAAAAADDDVE